MPKLSLNASRKTKHTSAGEIPVDWGWSPLEKVAEIQTGLSKSSNRKGESVEMPYLRVANVQDGHFKLDEIKTIEVPVTSIDRYKVKAGDVLLTEGGDFDKLGRGALWSGQIPDCVHQNHVFVVRTDPDKLNNKFFSYQTQGSRGRAYFKSCSKQSTNLASINSTQLKQFPAVIPPIKEQNGIVSVLSTWDTALEKLDALIRAKQQQKKALMQQLLTGKRRLPGFEGEWKSLKLKELAAESSLRNGNKLSRDHLYAVTKAHGMVPMREQVQGTAINRCKVVREGWFAYNPMRINIGSIARWEKSQPVMVSPDYVVFKTDETRLLSSYLNHFRRSIIWERFVVASGNGSVRVRIWFADLGIMKISVPPIPEQEAIIEILDASELEIRILKQQRDALDQERKGMMQKLLTGKLRVF